MGIMSLFGPLVQFAGGAAPAVVVFDVKSLLATTPGTYMLHREVRSILEDSEICKVG